ncbi:MAG: NADH-quinone oxidoreductase subunit J [Chloroflexi bacterium]|nr:NADH-quinone oxidoreductase subunit J [Chloroflexota bacterium]MBT4074642.1 NADH-quinone oxidoreductase subunit J [Chloroflexota bacterium]MBT4515834.1 NADH-quinone oxidoreductase subunit J [Chloroflexota bacterium]MBT5319799.1 NADH-quinone oxidoreductase subunit J [Chloroflexota bacterium]MBT6683041.1 NADH-quinone oxidoreductase subunit J [Chloroflexota bacterium]
MTAQLVVFYLLAAVTVLSSLGVVLTRNVVHAAFMLLLALLAVAGIFLMAVAEFLALAQILIYGGAVTVVVLFAIMLTRSDDQPRADHSQRPLALLTAVGVFALLVIAFVASDVASLESATGVGTDTESGFEALGLGLFTDWAIPFEVASLVLLVALIGAILLARSAEDGE